MSISRTLSQSEQKKAIEVALDKLIADIFAIIPPEEKKGTVGVILPESSEINSRNLTLESPEAQRKQYGLAVLFRVYNVLVKIRKPFLDNVHLLDGLDGLYTFQKVARLVWNGKAVLNLKEEFDGLEVLDQDINWRLPLGVDHNSQALLSCLQVYFQTLLDLPGFSAKLTVSKPLDEIKERINAFDAFQLPQTLLVIQDLKSAAVEYNDLNALSSGITGGISYLMSQSKEIPAGIKKQVNDALEKMISDLQVVSNELKAIPVKNMSSQQISYYLSLIDTLLVLPRALVPYADANISDQLMTEAYLAMEENLRAKSKELRNFSSPEKKSIEKKEEIIFKRSPDKISNYIDSVCKQLNKVLEYLGDEGNSETREKTLAAIEDIKNYKNDYLTAQMDSVERVNVLKDKVINRLDNLVDQKYHRVVSGFEKVWVNYLHVLVERVKEFFGGKNTFSNIFNRKLKYEARCRFFSIKNQTEERLNKVTKEKIREKEEDNLYKQIAFY